MTAPSAGTAVAAKPPEKPLSPAAAEAKALREITLQIRGQQWGQGCSREVQVAVARYCIRNNLDPVRHVEVLGGRIYLTAEFYREKGADLLLDGTITPDEPRFVHHDDRLVLLAKRDDDTGKWAKAELDERTRLRIIYGVDEDSPGAALVKFKLKSGATIIGVNWIVGSESKKKDPVGRAEPTKTAITRAERRAWRQVVEAIPSFRDKVGPIEASARLASAEIAEVIQEEKAQVESGKPTPLLQHGDDAYATGAKAETPGEQPAIPPYIANLLKLEAAGETLHDGDAEELRQWRLDSQS